MTNGRLSEWFVAKDNPPTLAHAIQTAAGAVTSYLIARLFHLPEPYWAPIATLVVTQTTLTAALPLSAQYFAGTAAGAMAGALINDYFPRSVWAFGAGVLVMGLLGVALQVPRSAFRYANITMAIVMLITRSDSSKLVAFHRFVEVSLGLAVGLGLFALSEKVSVGFPAKRGARDSA
jgi:uncharacterized membrane protein YccC